MIFETGLIFETVYVIQCSRNASNETNIKFSIYLEQNLLRKMFLGSRLSSGGSGYIYVIYIIGPGRSVCSEGNGVCLS